MNFIFGQVYFWVGSAICGYLYGKTFLFVRSVKKEKQNERFIVLTKAFAVITVAWVICEGPHVVYKVAHHWVWVATKCNQRYFHHCHQSWCSQVDNAFSVVEVATVMLKNLFPLLNTVLLLILVRPLQEHFLRCRDRLMGRYKPNVKGTLQQKKKPKKAQAHK